MGKSEYYKCQYYSNMFHSCVNNNYNKRFKCDDYLNQLSNDMCLKSYNFHSKSCYHYKNFKSFFLKYY